MSLLYTRNLVQQAADSLGNQHLVAKYFNEDPKAFEQVDAVLKDASYGDSPDGKP